MKHYPRQWNQRSWYVTDIIDGVVNVIQDIDNDGWIEWVPLDEYASIWSFTSFAQAFICCDSPTVRVWEYPREGIPLP